MRDSVLSGAALTGVEVAMMGSWLPLLMCMFCKLVVVVVVAGFGEIGGGVAFGFTERDLFGGSAGGRLGSFAISLIVGAIENV